VQVLSGTETELRQLVQVYKDARCVLRDFPHIHSTSSRG